MSENSIAKSEHWLLAEIRSAQGKNKRTPGLIEHGDDGGPGLAEKILESMQPAARNLWKSLGVANELLAMSSPEEIAKFLKMAGKQLGPAPVIQNEGRAIIVSDTLRGTGCLHRSFSKTRPAFCGAAPAGPHWQYEHEAAAQTIKSRNCQACADLDPNDKEDS